MIVAQCLTHSLCHLPPNCVTSAINVIMCHTSHVCVVLCFSMCVSSNVYPLDNLTSLPRITGYMKSWSYQYNSSS